MAERKSRRGATLRNLRMTVSYDGTGFRGFEVVQGQRSIRGELQHAIEQGTGEQVRLHAGARTDAGVHALGQVVNFHSRASAPSEVLRLRISDHLPDAIAIREVVEVDRGFHARHDAIARRYRYVILREKTPLLRHQGYWVRSRLNVDLMREALSGLEGGHDLLAFGAPDRDGDSRVTIQECELQEEGVVLALEILADRFLWKMVRHLAGTLIAVGREQVSPSIISDALADPKGEAAAAVKKLTAPAQGLILVRVIYPSDIKPQAAKLFPLRE